ncbi:MAG: tetratricopeptide repeat protein [Candidatus Heimdallarchaeota archaeon]
MSYRRKTQVASETDKRKAEWFNLADQYIETAEWDKALEMLQYLYRNAPSLRIAVNLKLAKLYLARGNSRSALKYLYPLLPSTDITVIRMLIESLLRVGNTQEAIWQLSKVPLSRYEKESLFRLIMEKQNGQILESNHLFIYCSRCFKPQFFINGVLQCLKCNNYRKD